MAKVKAATKLVEAEVEQKVENTEVATKSDDNLTVQEGTPLGFDDEDASDMIIPRVKIIQALSPERKDKSCDEGEIINSLTKENLNGKVFIPVFKFSNIILWRDRADGGGIEAISRDCKTMVPLDGSAPYPVGNLASFDNTKTGKDALPKATKYMNFFGFFEGERVPIILGFAKTNYNEGRKLYSLAKISMQNMWNHGYKLTEKLMAKNGNEWYNITITAAGPTSEEDRAFAAELFKTFSGSIQNINYDMEDNSGSDEVTTDVTKTEF